MCKLHVVGSGLCGRVAPHGINSRIQQGIEDFKKKQADPSILLWHQEPISAEDACPAGRNKTWGWPVHWVMSQWDRSLESSRRPHRKTPVSLVDAVR